MNTYELTTKYLSTFEVVENGPDATDYVVATVKGENPARLRAAAYRNATAISVMATQFVR